ncbi:MAG: UDP-glucose 4-epimerase GalE [Caldithrix sp.]|nr:UDP-glucose 4-epimerase GalE [Caldithrix sp.]
MSERKPILVTGGAGYIGSHVVHDLCDLGYEVVILDNFSLGRHENVDERARLIEGDLMSEHDLELAFKDQPEIVFHFAAYKAAGESMVQPQKYAYNNICGTLRLLNMMVDHKVNKFVFSSSAAVYGAPRYLPIDEEHPKNPENYYGYTKLAIEQNLAWYSQIKGLNFAALRYFNATGYDINGRIKGKEKNPANLSPIIMETASGIRQSMQVFGDDYDTEDGTCIRDYIHVNDLSSAHLAAMDYIRKNKENLVINLGTGKGHTVLQMIEAARRVTGREIPYQITDRREGDPPELVASSALAHQKLNWMASHSDLDSIFKTMKEVYLNPVKR